MKRISVKALLNAINQLPDAKTHPEDIIKFTGYEPLDPKAKERPDHIYYSKVYFERNIERNGWNLVMV